MRKILGRTAAVIAVVAAPLALAVPAAHADDFGEAHKNPDGTWKAYGRFNDGNNQLCVRAYNSVSGARGVIDVYLTSTGGQIGRQVDPGGDDEPSCGDLNGYENASVYFRVSHVGTGGAVGSTYFYGRTL